METHTIFFIGKPGSGKGTQAKLLSEATGWPIRVMSDGLREIIADGGVAGRKIEKDMNEGALVPSWIPTYVFAKWLFALPKDGNIVFDGFNRKVPEAELITSILRWIERPFTVINIAVSDESVRTRLKLRKEIEGRVDDSVVDRRLEEYYANTAPVRDFFRTEGVLIDIDGEPSPEEIFVDIKAKLGIA